MFKTSNQATKKTEPFAMIPIALINNHELSPRDKMLFIYILSKPKEWKFFNRTMCNQLKIGKDALSAAITCLVEKGYIVRHQHRRKNGRFWYNTYEVATNTPLSPIADPIPIPENSDIILMEMDTNIVQFPEKNQDKDKPTDYVQNVNTNPLNCIDKLAKPLTGNPTADMTPHRYIEISNINLRKDLLRKSSVELRSTMHTENPVSVEESQEDNEIEEERECDRPCAKGKYKETAIRLLAFLNLRANRVFRPVDTNLNFIIARLKSGATEQDCKTLICRKIHDWKGTELERYLRPATLFNKTKFEQYLGELVSQKDDE